MRLIQKSLLLTAICIWGYTRGQESPLCPPPQDFAPGYYDPRLPDPFITVSGAPVLTKAQWACRQQEISALLQNYELGTLPPPPQKLTQSYSPGNLTITATEAGKSITFSVTIALPSTGSAPYPAIIAYDGPSIPIPSEVAVITLVNDNIAQQNDLSSRGVGLFYELFGTNASASSMVAWAWATSRVIDALERTPQAGIDTTKLAITGCSRNGKGALVAGALEPRITLTIPQESGSGGDACWRLSLYEQQQGDVVQTATEIVTENVWFSTNFDNYVSDLPVLPFDHHMLAGLIAPRALLTIQNTAYEWLSPMSEYGCMVAARKVWDALGVPDNMGYSQVGNHSHCVFPDDQVDDVMAFFDKFLLGQEADTDIQRSNFQFNGTRFDEGYWINWGVPTLF